MLVAVVFCWCHLLHRTVVPMLQLRGLVNHLFRAAHVLSLGSYWSEILKACDRLIKDTLTVVHYFVQDPLDRNANFQLLMCTYGEGKEWDALLPAQKQVIESVLLKFPGNWAGGPILFLCTYDGCDGGGECRARACKDAFALLFLLMFKRKLTIPNPGRWWKTQQTLRTSLCLEPFTDSLGSVRRQHIQPLPLTHGNRDMGIEYG